MSWLFYAVVSAVAAAATAVLAKVGVAGVPSTLATGGTDDCRGPAHARGMNI